MKRTRIVNVRIQFAYAVESDEGKLGPLKAVEAIASEEDLERSLVSFFTAPVDSKN